MVHEYLKCKQHPYKKKLMLRVHRVYNKQILISCRLLNLSILEVYMSLRKFYLINPISGLEVPWFQGLNNKDISFKEKVKV